MQKQPPAATPSQPEQSTTQESTLEDSTNSHKRKLIAAFSSSSKKTKPNYLLLLENLKYIKHEEVLQILMEELALDDNDIQSVKKDKINDIYPLGDALRGLHLEAAIDEYTTAIKSSYTPLEAKQVMVDYLMKSNKVTCEVMAIMIAGWLIKTFVDTKVIELLQLPSSVNVVDYYDKCYLEYLTRNNIIPPTISIDDLNHCIRNCTIEIGTIMKKKYDGHIELPSFKRNLSNELAFHLFPHLPSLQVSEENDKIIENNIENSKLPVIIISPSGMGKTGLIIRSLSRYPGTSFDIDITSMIRSDTPQTISSQLLTLSDREEIMEPVIGIALTSLDITLKSMIVSTKYVLQPDVIPILDCKVRCKRLFNSSSFYDYCKDNNWIDSESDKYSGEQLFFRFIKKEDYQKIDQIALFPSDHNHTDIYLFYLANYTPVHFRISIKALTGNDLDIGYKSLAPELMYLNEYNTIDLETITLLRKNDTPTSVLNNFINNFSKGIEVTKAKQELKIQIGNGSSDENQSTTVNEIESNINENDNSVESTFNELESIKELDTDSEFDLFVKNIKEANNSKLNEWWESSRCQVWESIKKGVSLNVIIRLHPNKEVERLSRNKYSNIICIGKQSFSTLFPYLSNSVETFLQNQRINTSKPLL
ncbi:predicted protein [Naegleria gruberi]|uniref:Predicted protein n=1 Tax=Naegleria gruberi TaxID=5762 RepID=D2VTS3_NAEGR|nr:uncharacterized protein NAEGRDRAFT_52188 [Naegleria gruberi]EFC39774.1 predicted protein [Naegleria gruberi]|eukprot:XP_002672518.1 predicted protein [Naegleria gruberi strain NEG-M]